ncbi:hypothetical protein ABIB57_004776 [Devosia sp. UYZn731]|uniref:hypothetical protein n=1 Tax=Devosia sp. UYZn731 TaxID=3156345 RepID=UPI0033953B5F
MIDAADLVADPQLAECFGILASASADILRGAGDPAMIANPYLHPRNIHPGNLTLYRPLIDGLDEPRTGLKNKLVGLRALGTALRDKSTAWQGDDVSAPIDVLFVSHLLRPEQATSGQDLYYGRLPEELQQHGLRCAVAMINHTGLSWASIAPRWKKQPAPRLLLARTLSALGELRNGFALTRAGRRLKSHSSSDALIAELAIRAAMHSSSGTARSALRIGMQVAALTKHTRARVVVMTYEGHAWERLAMLLARRSVPDIQCVGYSHAVLFPEPRAMTASLGAALDPNHILTAGTVTRDKLKELVQMPNVRLGVLGSVRRGTAALSPDRPQRCLVLPEGLVSESVPLILAAIQAAKLLPDVKFRIRLHPVLKREQLLSEAPLLRSLPTNVEWSDQGPLEADFVDCRWLLYRGTSAVFQGVEAGLKPFYLGLPGEFSSIDPLADLDAWRVAIKSGADLASAMSNPTDVKLEQAELAAARLYCSTYFAPINPAALIDIANGVSGQGALAEDSRFA